MDPGGAAPPPATGRGGEGDAPASTLRPQSEERGSRRPGGRGENRLAVLFVSGLPTGARPSPFKKALQAAFAAYRPKYVKLGISSTARTLGWATVGAQENIPITMVCILFASLRHAEVFSSLYIEGNRPT